MIMAHRKVERYQLDECQSSTINKNRKRITARERERIRRDIIKRNDSQKLDCCLLEKDCCLILLQDRLSCRAQRDLILFILIGVM
jgi:hypothetical protein